MGGGGDGGAGQARADEEARQRRIREGTAKVNEIMDTNFTDDFFGSRQSSYMDYATPQLNDQYTDARKKLAFSLDRSGLGASSVAAEKNAELQKLYDQNRQQVADKALSYGTEARGNIEDARANLISTLNATGDNVGTAAQAINRAKVLSQPEQYSPLGDLFSSFTGTIGQQAEMDKARALASQFNTRPLGLFNSYGGSVEN